MNITLCIGCWGHTEDGFCSCRGVENEILDLTSSSKRNNEIKNYLDTVYRMYDKPLYNNVHTCVWNVQEKFSDVGKSVFDKMLFKRIEGFCILHRQCGLFLKLKLMEE